jgi:hypothetical protein
MATLKSGDGPRACWASALNGKGAEIAMRVYIVLAKDGAESISDAIREQKLPHYEIKDDAWLVASNDTTRELAAGLGIRGGEKGSGLERWPRLSEQLFRVDKCSVCRG